MQGDVIQPLVVIIIRISRSLVLRAYILFSVQSMGTTVVELKPVWPNVRPYVLNAGHITLILLEFKITFYSE